jgi:hypothetical protein
MFDVRRSSVSFSIKLAASMAGPGLNSKQFLFRFDWLFGGQRRR